MTEIMKRAKVRSNSNNKQQAYLTHMSMGHQLSANSSKTKDDHHVISKDLEAKKSINLQERIHLNRIESEKKLLIIDLEHTLK